MLVVGSRNSSNSNRLREVAKVHGARSYLINGPEDMDKEWLQGVETIGLTAGASAPELLVQKVLQQLQAWGVEIVEELNCDPENITFPVPKALRA